jgi:prefoldin subunit 5
MAKSHHLFIALAALLGAGVGYFLSKQEIFTQRKSINTVVEASHKDTTTTTNVVTHAVKKDEDELTDLKQQLPLLQNKIEQYQSESELMKVAWEKKEQEWRRELDESNKEKQILIRRVEELEEQVKQLQLLKSSVHTTPIADADSARSISQQSTSDTRSTSSSKDAKLAKKEAAKKSDKTYVMDQSVNDEYLKRSDMISDDKK